MSRFHVTYVIARDKGTTMSKWLKETKDRRSWSSLIEATCRSTRRRTYVYMEVKMTVYIVYHRTQLVLLTYLTIPQQGFCAQQPAPPFVSTTPCHYSLPVSYRTAQILNPSYLLLPPTGNTAPAPLQLTQYRKKSQIPLSWIYLFPGGDAPPTRL